MRRPVPLVALLALAAVAVPGAQAHGAPTPDDAFTRLLEDQNDDCGGHASAPVGACRGSNDLIALDVQEAHDATLGDALVFRLYMDVAASHPVTNTVTFGAGGAAKTLAMRSADDRSFTAVTGFERVGPARPLQDGTRFMVDGTVSLSALGLSAGQALSGFRVESQAGSAVGDFMPGGCNHAVGPCAPPASDADRGYTRPSYALRGPTYYASLALPQGTQRVPTGPEGTVVQLQVTNLLRSPQDVRLSVAPSSGVEAGFHAGGGTAGAAYRPQLDLSLQGRASTTVHLRLQADGPGRGELAIAYTTSQGGRGEAALPYEAVDAPGPTATGEPPTATTAPRSSPAAPAALLALSLLALALRRRS